MTQINIGPESGFREAQTAVHLLAREKGWYDGHPRNIAEMIALIHAEASEALEEWRDSDPDNPEWPLSRVTREGKLVGFETELADIAIRVMDLAEFVGVDLAQAICDKHAYNQTRPRRHGGKLA